MPIGEFVFEGRKETLDDGITQTIFFSAQPKTPQGSGGRPRRTVGLKGLAGVERVEPETCEARAIVLSSIDPVECSVAPKREPNTNTPHLPPHVALCGPRRVRNQYGGSKLFGLCGIQIR